MRHRRVLSRGSAAVAATAALLLIGCGEASPETAVERTTTSNPPPEPAAEPPVAALRPPPCPADAANCEEATGVIIYVEKVDADGDGDAHFVLTSADSITGPGISVIDVAVDLRPHPLPKPGEQLSASGPVYSGSYGQSQIQATAIRVGPAL